MFEFYFHIGFFFHSVVPDSIYLPFYLADLTRRIAFFFFASNMLLKRHSNFLALGFLTGVGVKGYLGLLLVNLSGVENIAASIISLNCCWSSHFTGC